MRGLQYCKAGHFLPQVLRRAFSFVLPSCRARSRRSCGSKTSTHLVWSSTRSRKSNENRTRRTLSSARTRGRARYVCCLYISSCIISNATAVRMPSGLSSPTASRIAPHDRYFFVLVFIPLRGSGDFYHSPGTRYHASAPLYATRCAWNTRCSTGFRSYSRLGFPPTPYILVT